MEKNDDILLKVEHLKKYYPVKSSSLKRSNGFVKAVDDISFDVKVGETFGIVGESGCGKSTMGKSVIRLIEPTDGKVILDGQDFTALKGKELKKARENMHDVEKNYTKGMVKTNIEEMAMTVNNKVNIFQKIGSWFKSGKKVLSETVETRKDMKQLKKEKKEHLLIL